MIYRRVLDTAPVTRSFRSLRHPNSAGGEGAGRPGRCPQRRAQPRAVPADRGGGRRLLLDAEAILRASRLFLEDERVVAVGGTVRPVNGAG